MTKLRPVLYVMGGSPTSPNLGVSALGMSAAAQLRQQFPDSEIVLQDSTQSNSVDVPLASGGTHQFRTSFLHDSRSLRERRGTRLIEALVETRGRLPSPLQDSISGLSPALRELLRADVVFDISAGDAFTDLYGPGGFEHQLRSKRLVLRAGLPLVLLPQTLGPFAAPLSQQQARQIVEESVAVATRERNGLSELAAVLSVDTHGPKYDFSPDVAFSLPSQAVDLTAEPWWAKAIEEPIFGINVNGLLTLRAQDFGLVPYRPFLDALVDWAASQTRGRIALVPHVYGRAKQPSGRATDESDFQAVQQLLIDYKKRYGDRIGSFAGRYNAAQVKWLVGHCDFFVGARMHACIGGLSMHVPTATLAYSKKVAGVMGMVGIPESAIEARGVTVEECVESIARLYQQRGELRTRLESAMPGVRRAIVEYFSRLANRLTGELALATTAASTTGGKG